MHDAHGSNRLLLFFGPGQLSRSLIWCVTDLLIGYHLTVRLGLAGSVAGIILFSSFLLGAVLELLVAAWVERGKHIQRNVLRLQALAGVGSVVSGALLFAPPPDGIETVLYVCLCSVVFRIAYATLDVCQNALTSLLPRIAEETRRYVVTRTFVSSIGRLAASGLVFLAMRAASDDHADFWAVACVALPVVVSVFGLYHVASRSIDRNGEVVTKAFDWSHLPLRRLATPIFAMVVEVGFLGLMTRLIPLGFQGSYLVVAMVCGTIAGPAVGYACTIWVDAASGNEQINRATRPLMANPSTQARFAQQRFGRGGGPWAAEDSRTSMKMLDQSRWSQAIHTSIRHRPRSVRGRSGVTRNLAPRALPTRRSCTPDAAPHLR